jgi:hypothetical protein
VSGKDSQPANAPGTGLASNFRLRVLRSAPTSSLCRPATTAIDHYAAVLFRGVAIE